MRSCWFNSNFKILTRISTQLCNVNHPSIKEGNLRHTSLPLGFLVRRGRCLLLLNNLFLKLCDLCRCGSLGSYSGGRFLDRGWFLLLFWIISFFLVSGFLSNWFFGILLGSWLLCLLRSLLSRLCLSLDNNFLFLILLRLIGNFTSSLFLWRCLDNRCSLTFISSLGSGFLFSFLRRSIGTWCFLIFCGFYLSLLLFFLALTLIITLLFYCFYWGWRAFCSHFLGRFWFFLRSCRLLLLDRCLIPWSLFSVILLCLSVVAGRYWWSRIALLIQHRLRIRALDLGGTRCKLVRGNMLPVCIQY